MSDDPVARHLLLLRATLLAITATTSAASHASSALLFDIAQLDPDLSLVHITRDGGASSRMSGRIFYHDACLPPGHLTKVDGVLATTAARTVVDLARSLPFDAALVAAESALNLKLTTLAELDEVLAYCVDWPGARKAGRVVAFASPYSESPGETLGRIAFDALGVPQPHQQVYIFDRYGFIARCDYFWEHFRTVGESTARSSTWARRRATTPCSWRRSAKTDCATLALRCADSTGQSRAVGQNPCGTRRFRRSTGRPIGGRTAITTSSCSHQPADPRP